MEVTGEVVGDFDIRTQPQGIRQIASNFLTCGVPIGLIMGALKYKRSVTFGSLGGWYTWHSLKRDYDAFERLRNQDVEGMHFMKFDSLAPVIPYQPEEETSPEEIARLVKEADSKDEALLKQSYTVAQDKARKKAAKEAKLRAEAAEGKTE